MKNNLFFILPILLIIALNSNSQEYYWVSFSNKNNSEYSLSNPEKFLSERAIQRRVKQNIAIDSLDLPVNSNYISEVVNLGVELVHASKWLNGITVKVAVDSFQQKVLQLPFVKEVQLTKPLLVEKSTFDKFYESGTVTKEPIDTSVYGESVFQTGILNGQFLHNNNFKGQGMLIAILDGGFLNTDSFIAFDSLWANNQIIGTKDFVDPNSEIFSTHYHGMSVLSCIGGNVPGQLLGTAPKASFWLLRSEDTNTEYLIEEDNWVVAAEFADSVGADVINSSLGYSEYNDPAMNHLYTDMDGKTTRVTQGANVAASRGILVFSSAGNEGNDPWKYIIAPSDGDSVIGVGAVDKDGVPAFFTSYGPASDADVKPNVSALGRNTFLQLKNGELGYSNGTSFSSPVMAGMGACLWQANPQSTAFQIKQALEQSSHLYNKPDSLLGYGIPDMKLADQILKTSLVEQYKSKKQWLVYPNPVSDYIVLQKKGAFNQAEVTIELISIEGKLIRKWEKPGSAKIILREIPNLPPGLIILKVASDKNGETFKLNKIQ